MAYNLLPATGTLASPFHTRARTATLREHLINIPARIASSARQIMVHMPQNWPWKTAYDQLFTAVHAPPQTA